MLILEYDGTRCHGFQMQKNAPTIQGEVEQALWRLTGETIRVGGASRTDAGVHARGQVVCFRTGSALSPEAFIKGLNYYLSEDIGVRCAFQVADGFNVRRDALSREYRYTIHNGATPSPLHRKHAYFVSTPLDVEAMAQACQVLVGKQDFASFAGPMGLRSTVRTVYKAQVHKEGELVLFDMVADSFLTQQVRRTVGALVQVGLGKADVEEFWGLVASRKSGSAGPVVPSHGLCLMKVNYHDDIWGHNEDL